jgi:hypothetical protein
MATYFWIAAGALLVVALVVHEVRSWRKPGRSIGLNAPMDSDAVNQARLAQGTNPHGDGSYDPGVF